MESLIEIIKYKNTKGKMLYTFLIHSISCDQVKLYLKDLIIKISTMKDIFKRNQANEKIKNFELYFDNINSDQIINSIYLVDSNEIKSFILNSNDVKTLVDFKIPHTNYYCDEYYYIDYLINILDITKLVSVCSVDNSNATIISMDSVKNRIIRQTNIESVFETIDCKLYYGLNSSQYAVFNKKYPLKKIHCGKLTKEEVWTKILKDKSLEAQEKFNNEVLIQLTNPEKQDLFIFGRKDVGNQILNYGVKKLFITSKLYNIMLEHIDQTLLNFEIIILEKNSDGDYTDILIKNFGGLVGIKYY